MFTNKYGFSQLSQEQSTFKSTCRILKYFLFEISVEKVMATVFFLSNLGVSFAAYFVKDKRLTGGSYASFFDKLKTKCKKIGGTGKNKVPLTRTVLQTYGSSTVLTRSSHLRLFLFLKFRDSHITRRLSHSQMIIQKNKSSTTIQMNSFFKRLVKMCIISRYLLTFQ